MKKFNIIFFFFICNTLTAQLTDAKLEKWKSEEKNYLEYVDLQSKAIREKGKLWRKSEDFVIKMKETNSISSFNQYKQSALSYLNQAILNLQTVIKSRSGYSSCSSEKYAKRCDGLVETAKSGIEEVKGYIRRVENVQFSSNNSQNISSNSNSNNNSINSYQETEVERMQRLDRENGERIRRETQDNINSLNNTFDQAKNKLDNWHQNSVNSFIADVRKNYRTEFINTYNKALKKDKEKIKKVKEDGESYIKQYTKLINQKNKYWSKLYENINNLSDEDRVLREIQKKEALKKAFKYIINENCPIKICNSGLIEQEYKITCKRCKGQGKERENYGMGVCHGCDGLGTVWESRFNECTYCSGHNENIPIIKRGKIINKYYGEFDFTKEELQKYINDNKTIIEEYNKYTNYLRLSDKIKKTGIEWVNINKATELSKKTNKKILIYFYADWCNSFHCQTFNNKTLSNKDVSRYINENYIPVRFEAQCDIDVIFKGNKFINPNYNVYKNENEHNHQFVNFMKIDGFPALSFLDENLNFISNILGYRTVSEMELYLKLFAGNDYKSFKTKEQFDTYRKNFISTFKEN